MSSRAARPAGTYRADVDGLRAVAVLSVILFHFRETPGFNGFVGVDIFFVISGFLITKNIRSGLAAGTFSLGGFYLGRVKRILPAFYVVALATLAFCALVMIPEDLELVSRSILAATLSASNVFFWKGVDSGYFDRTSEFYPLLHTWSLGVEEQFYLLWPAVLLLAARFAPRPWVLPAAVLAVIAASAALAEYALGADQVSFAYYMLPARAGELLVGALVAFARTDRASAPTARPWVPELMALGGMGLILISLFHPGLAGRFPGLNALLPCAGTALVIRAGALGTPWVTKALSLRPLVVIGLLSYSLYLWHWPLLALGKYLFTAPSTIQTLAVAALTALLAAATYRWVETPLRHARLGRGQVVAYYLLLPSLALAGGAGYLYATQGMRDAIAGRADYRNALEARDSYTKPAYEYDYVCQTSKYTPENFTDARCLVGPGKGAPEVLLWGDSHAAHYVGFLGAVARAEGFSFRNVEIGDCPPVFRGDIDYGPRRGPEECRKFRARAAEAAASYEYVALGGAWTRYAPNEAFLPDLVATVDSLRALGRKVIVLLQPPVFDAYDRSCGLRRTRPIHVECRERADIADAGEGAVNRSIREALSGREGIRFVSARAGLCAEGRCSPYRDGRPLYFDRTHLSIAGSWDLGARFADTAAALVGRRPPVAASGAAGRKI